MSQNIGQPVVVENRPGASSIIAAQYVANAAPDGYTIMSIEQGSMVFNTALYSKLPYDPAKDIAPVCDMIRAPVILAVNPNFPAKDLKSFVDQCGSSPASQLRLARPGTCAPARDGGLQAARQARHRRRAVQGHRAGRAGRGGGPDPDGAIDTVVILPHLRAGKLRALASFSDKRLAATPDVPAMGELGYEGLDIAPIVGVGAPAKTPRGIIEPAERRGGARRYAIRK